MSAARQVAGVAANVGAGGLQQAEQCRPVARDRGLNERMQGGGRHAGHPGRQGGGALA